MDARFWRDSSQRLTFDLAISDQDYPAICRAIVDAFALTQVGQCIVGLEQMFCEWRHGESVISLDWDIWMNFMVVANSAESEPLVRDIATWICESRWASLLLDVAT